MINQKKTVALIPLRGGSKGIPKKNIKQIAGMPMCFWVLHAAVCSQYIDEVYVSTDCEEIASVVENLDLEIKVIDRPANLATDEASTESVMLHFVEQIDFDLLVTIQATSPMLSAKLLDDAYVEFIHGAYDSMLSASRIKRFFWQEDGTPINYEPINRPRRQEFKGSLMENGAFYITTRDALLNHGCRLAGNIGVFETPESLATEIDSIEDWEIVERLLLAQVGSVSLGQLASTEQQMQKVS